LFLSSKANGTDERIRDRLSTGIDLYPVLILFLSIIADADLTPWYSSGVNDNTDGTWELEKRYVR